MVRGSTQTVVMYLLVIPADWIICHLYALTMPGHKSCEARRELGLLVVVILRSHIYVVVCTHVLHVHVSLAVVDAIFQISFP